MGRLAAILLLACAVGCAHAPDAKPQFRDSAIKLLLQVEEDFFRDDKLYCEQIVDARQSGPAFCWPASQQLSAIAAAARVEPFWRVRLSSYIAALDAHFLQANNIGGYDASANPKHPDRYYDDNAWMALALLDAYEVTQDPEHLRRAKDALSFVLSGQDDQLGGGIWWREQEKNSKHACSTAPAIVACLRMYRITGDVAYLGHAETLNQWITTTLQDIDWLIFDHVGLDGAVDRAKFSYNTATMIRAQCLWFDITDDVDHLKTARQMAASSTVRWIDFGATAISDDAAFASMLAESLLELYRRDGDERWYDAATRAIAFVAFKNADPAGWHPPRWDQAPSQPLRTIRLIDQAAAARAMLVAEMIR